MAKTQTPPESRHKHLSLGARLKKILAVTISGAFLLILAVSFGQVDGCDRLDSNALAVVHGREIHPGDPELAFYLKRIQESQPEARHEQSVGAAVMQVVRDHLLLVAAKDNRIKVTDDLMLALLEDWLRSQQGATLEGFAAQPREYRRMVERSLAESYLRQAVQTDIISAVRLTDAELSIIAEMGARSAAVRLVAVNPLEYAAAMPVDDAALEAFFSRNIAKYSNCMQASHILLKGESEAGEIRKRLVEKREDFAALARQYSQDPVSAANGGRLGWFFPDSMIEAFSQAAAALAPGEISQPVKSQYGFHLIRLEARRAFTKAAEMDRETRDQLIRAYKSGDSANFAQQAERMLEERLNQLRNMVASGNTDFNAAARSLGLQPIETGFFRFLTVPPTATAHTNLLGQLAGEAEFQAQSFSLAAGSVSPILRIARQMVVLSPIGQRYDTNRGAAVAANPQRLQNLPERLRDEITREIASESGMLQQRSQYLLFNDWIAALWNASGAQIEWKRISDE